MRIFTNKHLWTTFDSFIFLQCHDAILFVSRDVVLTKKCGNAPQNIAILKQLQTHFKAKCEKDVGTPFPRVSAPLHLCSYLYIAICSPSFPARGIIYCADRRLVRGWLVMAYAARMKISILKLFIGLFHWICSACFHLIDWWSWQNVMLSTFV